MPDCAPNEAMYTPRAVPILIGGETRRLQSRSFSSNGETKEVWGVVWEVQVVEGVLEVDGEDGEARC